MLKFLLGVVSWIIKNTALLVGILEAIVKVAGGIISITPTKSDDKILPVIDNVFSWVKKILYTVSDKMAGKEVTVKN